LKERCPNRLFSVLSSKGTDGQSATVLVAENGFRKRGLYPRERYVFNDYEFVEDTTVKTSTSSASQSFTAPSDISPVPHLQGYSAQSEYASTSQRGSETLITWSPHKNELTENTEKIKLSAENKETKRNISNRKINISSSSSSTEVEEIGLILVSTDEEGSKNDAQRL
jgi:hypothetical protein